MHQPHGRRDFLRLLSGAFLALIGSARSARAHPRPDSRPDPRAVAHPEPRPGIDASRVLKADELANPSAAPVYDMVREMPEVADGIRCHCGCADLDGYYSLLTCYEEQGMAQFCDICKGQARQAFRLHQDGKSLDAIRTATDARYG